MFIMKDTKLLRVAFKKFPQIGSIEQALCSVSVAFQEPQAHNGGGEARSCYNNRVQTSPLPCMQPCSSLPCPGTVTVFRGVSTMPVSLSPTGSQKMPLHKLKIL